MNKSWGKCDRGILGTEIVKNETFLGSHLPQGINFVVLI
jgi:hypothetical protein